MHKHLFYQPLRVIVL